ncbi:MAG: hypothetical protein WA634_13675, partial [Silvibacterium sp.]
MAKTKKSSSFWVSLFPLLVGILVTPLALHMAGVLTLSGPDAMTFLYPWVQVVRSPVLHVTADIAIPVAQWIMYLQFPVYGLAMTWILLRSRRSGLALMVAVALHVGG